MKATMPIRVLAACLVLVAQSAYAEFEIKRLKCSEFEHTVFYNRSADEITLSVQIVRDGCIPKDGSYLVLPSGYVAFEISRIGKSGPVYKTPVTSGGSLSVRFLQGLGANRRGTFDVRVETH